MIENSQCTNILKCICRTLRSRSVIHKVKNQDNKGVVYCFIIILCAKFDYLGYELGIASYICFNYVINLLILC